MQHSISKLFLLLFVYLFFTSVQAAPIVSLGDLNKVAAPGFQPYGIQSETKFFFSRDTAEHGIEPWVSDGTAAGTSLLKDIVPGTGSSTPIIYSRATFGGQPGAYFFATTPTHGTELWKTDGTPAGTQLVKDIAPGAASSVQQALSTKIFNLPNTAFAIFAANDQTNGNEIWITDGTSGGTNMITDINPGAGSSNPADFVLAGALVIFTAESGSGRELWVTNGAASSQVMDINPGAASSNPRQFALLDNRLVFLASNGTDGRELWQTDLMTTSLVTNLTPGAADSLILGITRFDADRAFFNYVTQGVSGITLNLMRTNGTAAGTALIKTLPCLPGGQLSLFATDYFTPFKIINGRAVFSCLNLDTLEAEPWVSEGTAATTNILRDIFPNQFSSDTLDFFRGNGRLIFFANDGVHGYELWTTDGTTAGTQLLSDFNPGQASSGFADFIFTSIVNYNPDASASLIPLVIGKDNFVYYSDGTLAGTRELYNNNSSIAGATSSSDPSDFTAVGKNVVFAAQHTTKGYELFVSNGKKRGTKLLKNIMKSGDSNPSSFVNYNKKLVLFSARDQRFGEELWITDGTKRGTKLLKDIQENSFLSADINLFKDARIGRKLLFAATTAADGNELWITNGKRRGTKLLKDVNPGSASSTPENLVSLNNKVLFSARTGDNDGELWQSDGTGAGTTLLKDIYPGSDGSYPRYLTKVGNRVFFSAFQPATGEELWVSDGTEDGTMLVKDINPGAGDSSLQNLVASGNILFFVADDGTNGEELWRSDGTVAGTFMVKDIRSGAGDSSVREIVPLSGERVVFSANDNIHGREIWISGSALNSATLLKDIYPGASGSQTESFYKVPKRDRVYFYAYTDLLGHELWTTDGTELGTELVADIVPGEKSSYPRNFFAKGRKLFFRADNSITGTEPYVTRIP